MFLTFFLSLKQNGIPVTLSEYLTFLEALDKGLAEYNIDDFYALARAIFVKHEKYLDIFDRLFGAAFNGVPFIPADYFKQIPEEWLRAAFSRELTEEEKAMIQNFGGLDKLIERFKELLAEQKERHEGGSKWIGTGGTSPFGANGYNPEGFRIGQEGSRNRRAVKVWDAREFQNLDDSVELDTRTLKVALKRLRLLTREEGAPTELDLDETIERTSRNAGLLDLVLVPPERNRVKVLLFFDAGGSMDDHVKICAELFSAAKYQFKNMEFFYFHNCIYETVWKDNRRRGERVSTFDVFRRFNRDYKTIIVGDAAMSPYEVLVPGGSVEHYNPEAGHVWLERLKNHYPALAWLNPIREENWDYFESTGIIREKLGTDRMFPLTMGGLTRAMNFLKKTTAFV